MGDARVYRGGDRWRRARNPRGAPRGEERSGRERGLGSGTRRWRVSSEIARSPLSREEGGGSGEDGDDEFYPETRVWRETTPVRFDRAESKRVDSDRSGLFPAFGPNANVNYKLN